MNKSILRNLWQFGLVLILGMTLLHPGSVNAASKKISFADLSWDSIQVHNRIAGFILEHGYGYKPDYLPGETIPLVTGLRRGDIDVDMESWTENIQEVYDKGIKEGSIIDLGANYPDSWQGWLVPTYMIKGDPERGIKPMAPELKAVTDLPKYWELFKDPENPSKGRFYNSIPGWGVTKVNSEKFKAYGLDETFTEFMPGSDAALSGSMVAAYKKGKPWVGYYWAPTWILGKYDMTPLTEPPFDAEVWETTKKCAFASVKVNILVNKNLLKRAPDAIEMFKKYETTAALTNEILAQMEQNKLDTQQAAEWFLAKHEEVWTQWVSKDTAAKIKLKLK